MTLWQHVHVLLAQVPWYINAPSICWTYSVVAHHCELDVPILPSQEATVLTSRLWSLVAITICNG
jgi:hypothetical protein